MEPSFYRQHEIPGEGYAGITPKSSRGGGNGSMVGSLCALQILCSSGCQSLSHTTQHRRQTEALGMGTQ